MKEFFKIIRAMGIVFGDIGTSPIYTMTIIFLIVPLTSFNVLGVVSLIIWTLMLVVMVQYAWLAMSFSIKGEGGTIVLSEILLSLVKKGKLVIIITILSYCGISLLIGDGIVTPAITILSAVEGMKLIPHLAGLTTITLLIIAIIITVFLFSIQKNGIEKIANAFGPIMLVWFIVIFVGGAYFVIKKPIIFTALNPYYAILFLVKNKIVSFLVLAQVILCSTGGEALYADMGHLGRKPILKAWYLVFFALIFCYLGQGSFLLSNAGTLHGSILLNMFSVEFKMFYVPVLLLTVCASVIASQSMIAGIYAVVFQAINTRIFPMLRVKYTSTEFQSQIYINAVNWFLMFSTILMLIIFKTSDKLAYAYGLAVSGTMLVTSIFLILIFYYKKQRRKFFISSILLLINSIFLYSNFLKFFHGAFFPVLIGILPFSVILIYTKGQKRLFKFLKPLDKKSFLISYNEFYKKSNNISGTALYFVKNPEFIPPYVAHVMFANKIIYKENFFISINVLDTPYDISYEKEMKLAQGLSYFKINVGYMETVDIGKILETIQIKEDVIFYGQENITTENIIWKFFALIKRNTPHFVEFYHLSSNKTHGVVTRIKI